MADHSWLSPWIRRFLLEHVIEERNFTHNTQQSYRDAFCLLLPFASRVCKKPVDRLTVCDLSAEVIRAFLIDLEKGRGCTIATRNQRLATIHSLARFIGDRSPEHVEWCGQIRSIPFKRCEKNSITYLEKEEIDALLEVPDRSTRLGHRDHALLLFLYNSGARASEAVRVTIEDLDRNPDGTGSVKLHGKGRKVRFCPLWARTMTELLALTRGRAGDANLFLNRYGHRMTRFGVHTLVERHVQAAANKVPSLKNKQVSPHSIRHTTATHLLRAGVDINTIRAWLGHVSVDTTNIYAETDLAMKAKALAACDPGIGPANTQLKWRDDPNLMQFLRSL
jgi:site-specific recombinase XerD